jgi:hypothetical protein
MRKLAMKYGPQIAVLSTLATAASAYAVDPATAAEALATFSGTTTAYGPILFGLAVVYTGIALRIAWIKKARGAGR